MLLSWKRKIWSYTPESHRWNNIPVMATCSQSLCRLLGSELIIKRLGLYTCRPCWPLLVKRSIFAGLSISHHSLPLWCSNGLIHFSSQCGGVYLNKWVLYLIPKQRFLYDLIMKTFYLTQCACVQPFHRQLLFSVRYGLFNSYFTWQTLQCTHWEAALVTIVWGDCCPYPIRWRRQTFYGDLLPSSNN